jgi:hypothetical protein
MKISLELMALRSGGLCDARAALQLLALAEVSEANNSHRGLRGRALRRGRDWPMLSGDKNSADEIVPAFLLHKSVHCLLVAAHRRELSLHLKKLL